MSTKNKKVGVILMTYGSPKTLKDVPGYLKNVYGGKDASFEIIKEFQRRYELIGGSPLVKITKAQARSLQKELNKQYKNKISFTVFAGMRFSHPFIKETVRKFPKDISTIVGIIMSPQYSPTIMGGYTKELFEAVSSLKRKKLELKMATDWHLQPFFIQAMAEKITEALNKLPENISSKIPVLFSAHSMPKRVIDKEPAYVKDLKQTAAEIARKSNLPKNRWLFCYQSAGHTPEEWLKPDFEEVMPILKKKKNTSVLIAPVQFLADHLEILYDVGIAAKQQAEKYDIKFYRTDSLNTSPLFIKALAEVVKFKLKA